MKILIIKLGALGDVINTLPAVIRLKQYFNCEIHWLCAPLSYPVVVEHSSVDKIILFDKKKKTGFFKALMEIRQERYDLAIDFQRTIKSGFFCFMAHSREKLGFDKTRCKELTWLYPFTRIPPSDPEKHMLDQYLDFADHLGAPKTPVQWKIIKHELTSIKLPENYVVLNIGATKKANLWQPEKFAKLAILLYEKKGLVSVLTGGSEDQPMGGIIKAIAGGAVVDLTGKTTLNELIGVISMAGAVVSCDTGPMHLAVALGIRTLALFGPSNPRRTGPYKGEIIQKHHHCSPCNKKRCSDPRCMQLIQAEDVFSHIIEGGFI